jgi:uncharacterized protein (DUF305 family)
MRSLPARAAAAVAAAAVLVTAGAARAAAQTAPAAAPRPAAPVRSTGRAASDAAAIARARADSARLPYTAADIAFMTTMIGHHAQAITMSRLAPERAGSPSVRTLAARIINAQQDEIGIMQQWLRDRRQPVPEVGADGTVTGGGPAMAGHSMSGHDTSGHTMAGHGAAGHGAAGHAATGHDMSGHAAMPGMLTAAELRQLAAARGSEFDRLFLTSMIRHHRGATAMVKSLFGTYGAGQDETVFKFASDVNVDQTTEITRMQRMLAALLFGAPDAAP